MHCDPRFSRVREVFEQHFADGEELGAAFAVYLDGELVVDLWGGVADRHTGRPWRQGLRSSFAHAPWRRHRVRGETERVRTAGTRGPFPWDPASG